MASPLRLQAELAHGLPLAGGSPKKILPNCGASAQMRAEFMLTTLRIKNLALVADLTLELQPGYNAITGETGAGKSKIGRAHV